MRKLVYNPSIQYIIINLHTKYDYSSLRSFTEIFDENFLYFKYGKKENRTNTGKNKPEKAGLQSQETQTSLSSCLPNMTTPACMISQKSLTKNFIFQSMERKKIGQIHRRISMRRLLCNPTIQYIIINMHTKYEYSSLHSFTEIFDGKFHYSKYGKKEN